MKLSKIFSIGLLFTAIPVLAQDTVSVIQPRRPNFNKIERTEVIEGVDSVSIIANQKLNPGRRPYMPRVIKTVQISPCDTLLLPYAVGGLMSAGDSLLSAPLPQVDFEAIERLVSAAQLINNRAPQLDQLIERANDVKQAASIDRGFRNYFDNQLYSPSKAFSMNRNLKMERKNLTQQQCERLDENGDLLKNYDVATIYFLYVTQAISEDAEIVEMVAIKGNPALITVTVEELVNNELNAPRVAEITKYPALKKKFDEFVRAIASSNIELAQEIRNEVDMTMNAPQAFPI